VLGHVDDTGTVKDVFRSGDNYRFSIEFPEVLHPYIVNKGSIAIDGISLTVTELKEDAFVVQIIPHTFASTSARFWKRGAQVNIETDILGKFVEKILRTGAIGNEITFTQTKGSPLANDTAGGRKESKRDKGIEEKIRFYAKHGISIKAEE
jgi:riboflavin synthase alpha subunit